MPRRSRDPTEEFMQTIQSAMDKLMCEDGFSHARAVAAVTAEWELPTKEIPESKVMEMMQQFRIGSYHARQALGFSAALENRPSGVSLARKLEAMTQQLASADLVSSHAKAAKTPSSEPSELSLEESALRPSSTVPQRQQRCPPVAPRASNTNVAQTPAGNKKTSSKHTKKDHAKKDAPKASRKRSFEESTLPPSETTSSAPRPRADSVTQAVTAKLGDLPLPVPENKSTATPSSHKRARASSASSKAI